jgi:hypothetical protein
MPRLQRKNEKEKKATLQKIQKNIPPETPTEIESNTLFIIVTTADIKYNLPPELTEEINLNVVPFTSTTSALSTYTAPPSVTSVVLPVMPTLVSFAKKCESIIFKLLVELPINVPTTPCVDDAPEMPA